MLEDIIDSKLRANLAAFFVFGSKRGFSVLEISRLTRVPFLRAAHFLTKLSHANLIKIYTKKGRKYFILNHKFQLSHDLKKFLLKQVSTKNYEDWLVSGIKKVGSIKAAFLSGIFAGYSNLPVDVLLVGKVNLKKLADLLKKAERVMGQEINYSIMTKAEFLARRDTFDRFIRDIFDYRYITVCDALKNRKFLKTKKNY